MSCSPVVLRKDTFPWDRAFYSLEGYPFYSSQGEDGGYNVLADGFQWFDSRSYASRT